MAVDLSEPDQPEGQHSLTFRRMLATAAVNRTKALLNYHDDSTPHADHAIETALKHGGPDRAMNLVRAIYEDQAEAVEEATERHGLLQPPLNRAQIKAALNAAKDAGADEEAQRRTAKLLGVTPQMFQDLDLPEREPISWENAGKILLHTCGSVAPARRDKWDRVAEATGRDRDNDTVRLVRELTRGPDEEPPE